MTKRGEGIRSKFQRVALKAYRRRVVEKADRIEAEVVRLVVDSFRFMWSFSSRGFSQNPFTGAQWPPLTQGTLRSKRKQGTKFFFVTGALQRSLASSTKAIRALGKPQVRMVINGTERSIKQSMAFLKTNPQGVEIAFKRPVRLRVIPYKKLDRLGLSTGRVSRGQIEAALFGQGSKIFEKLTNPGHAYRNLVPNFLSWYLKHRIKTRIRELIR